MAVAGGKQSSRRSPPDTHVPQHPQHPHDSCLFAFPFPFTFPFAFLLSDAATLQRRHVAACCKMAFAARQQNGGGVNGSCFSQHTK